MPRYIDLTGLRFGRLLVVERGPHRAFRSKQPFLWVCRCDCGTRILARSCGLRGGTTVSCGCLHRERFGAAARTHGMLTASEYTVWGSMIQRCTNPRQSRFASYGARGIRICDRWLGRTGFANFLADMGRRPSPDHSIDRIDGDGNYEPSNCRWATRSEQQRNTSRTHFIEHAGERLPLGAWAERYGIAQELLRGRLWRGWPIDRALLTPVVHRRAPARAA